MATLTVLGLATAASVAATLGGGSYWFLRWNRLPERPVCHLECSCGQRFRYRALPSRGAVWCPSCMRPLRLPAGPAR